MTCKNKRCYNYDNRNKEYCDECIAKEMKEMSYDELSEMYSEGKEVIDGIKVNPVDEESFKIIKKFKEGWFNLINRELLNRK